MIAAEALDPTGRLGLLHQLIESALAPVGFAPEGRSFWAHVTLGRSRRGVRIEEIHGRWPGPGGAIDHFSLYESQLQPSGPRYTPVATFPLA